MIKFTAVTKSYGKVEVLKGVNTEFAKGQVSCLIGPSGSGKSTILRCINGLEQHTTGSINFDGMEVTPSPASLNAIRKKTAMVFQRFNLFPHRTALENVMEAPVYVHGVARKEAEEFGRELLNKVGLGHRVGAYPGTMSGGEQQRVAIARALAVKPQAILFDEPTSALDPELVGDVLKVIRDLASTGITMVIVTHEINFAKEVGDLVAFIDKGVIVEQGKPSDILVQPSQQRTQEFLRRLLDR